MRSMLERIFSDKCIERTRGIKDEMFFYTEKNDLYLRDSCDRPNLKFQRMAADKSATNRNVASPLNFLPMLSARRSYRRIVLRRPRL